ncbi:MAG: hypothetical protein HEP71_03020 [Roseivirga sp.]|nr:hypothetical protein [Roseivirga sp.]
MLKHLTISILRSLKRNRVFTAINVGGLAIALLAAITILSHVAYEYSFDAYQKDFDDVYRLSVSYTDVAGNFGEHAGISNDIAGRLKAEMPEVLQATRIHPLTGSFRHTIMASENEQGPVQFSIEQLWAVDIDAFDIFTFNVLKGNNEDLINTIEGIAISESMAIKFFGNENPIGKTMKLNGQLEFSVTVVFEDWPDNSHINPDILLQKRDLEQRGNDREFLHFLGSIDYTYLKLAPQSNLTSLQRKLDAFVAANKRPQDMEDARLNLMRASDIHLEAGHMMRDMASVTNKGTLTLLIGLVALILSIAWFNYINLNTSLTIRKIKEIAVRRIHGAGKAELFAQQLLNTSVFILLALGLAFTIYQGAYGYLNRIIGTGGLDYLVSDPWLMSGLGLFLIVAVLISALYPTVLLNGLKSRDMIKGSLGRIGKGDGLKKTLVTTQFAITIGLLFATLTVIYQLRHLKSAETNLEMDQVVVINGPGVRNSDHKNYAQAINAFKNGLLGIPGVKAIATSNHVPGYKVTMTGGFSDPQNEENPPIYINRIFADGNYAEVYGIEVVAGRFFTNQMEIQDINSRPLVLNESAVKQLGFKSPEEIVGKKVKYFGEPVEIIGVMKDFSMESPDVAITGLMFYPALDSKYFSVRVTGAPGQEIIDRIENLFKEVYPGNPFDYFFSEANFNKQFQSFELFEKQLSILAVLSICLASLGLLALAYDSTYQRIKEIGVRKILGASVGSIIQLLLSGYLRLIVLAAIIITPIIYYSLQNWLNQYASRISIGADLLMLPALGTIVLAALMVGFQSMKTARMNPVDTLRHE